VRDAAQGLKNRLHAPKATARKYDVLRRGGRRDRGHGKHGGDGKEQNANEFHILEYASYERTDVSQASFNVETVR